MASNEEIIKQFTPCKDFYPTTVSELEDMLDAARKDEAVGILKFLTDKDSPYAICYGSDTPFATIGDDYTIEQLYTIFKNQNS